MDIKLKYGCNPNQLKARIHCDCSDGPLSVLNGSPSYINILDALRGWQLVRELRTATDQPAAASFKHVSPAGVAIAGSLPPKLRQAQHLNQNDLSPIATAYAKARSSDRVASFGDFIASSDPVDESLAYLIKPEVSDGIIAPDFEPAAAQLLKEKKSGSYVMLKIESDFEPPEIETRTEFGLCMEQARNNATIDQSLLTNVVSRNKELNNDEIQTAIVATLTLKHTQSNSICVAYQGQAIGIGAGQQSRIACTRLACDKADRWMLQQHPKVLSLELPDELSRVERFNLVDQFLRYDQMDSTEQQKLAQAVPNLPDPLSAHERNDWIRSFDGLVLSSDAFIPFRDNIDRAVKSAVRVVVQTGNSNRDEQVIAAANDHGIVMVFTNLRLFLH